MLEIIYNSFIALHGFFYGVESGICPNFHIFFQVAQLQCDIHRKISRNQSEADFLELLSDFNFCQPVIVEVPQRKVKQQHTAIY